MAALTLAGSAGIGRRLRRAGRRTNVAILLLLVGALLSGPLLFAAASPVPAALARLGHDLVGVGLVVLVPWKTVVILRARQVRPASLVLLALVLVCLGSGFVQVFGGYGRIAGISPIQVHVGSALGAVLFAVLHVVRHRPVAVRRSDLSRRRLLTTGGFALGIGGAYALAELLGRLTGSAAATRLVTGSHRLTADAIPATTWLLDQTPGLDSSHLVRVGDASLSHADLDAQGSAVAARLDCTSGWYAEATWTGVPLIALLDAEAVRRAASIEVRSITGYRRRFPASDAARLWLATQLEGRPLQPGQGAPVRLVAPGRRGFWWVKWVSRVELSDRPSTLQPPFPLQ